MFFQFAVPIETKSELPWSTVAEMLKDKMRKLSDRRSLTEDNLNHLKHRILGKNKMTLVGCGTGCKYYCRITRKKTSTSYSNLSQ